MHFKKKFALIFNAEEEDIIHAADMLVIMLGDHHFISLILLLIYFFNVNPNWDQSGPDSSESSSKRNYTSTLKPGETELVWIKKELEYSDLRLETD